MKKLFAILLVAAMAFSLTACNEKPVGGNEDADADDIIFETPGETPEETETPEDPDEPAVPEEEEPAEGEPEVPEEDPGTYEEALPEDVETFVTTLKIPVPPFFINNTFMGEKRFDLGDVIHICNLFEFTYEASEDEIRAYCAAIQDAWKSGSFNESSDAFSFDARFEDVYSILIVWNKNDNGGYIEGKELLESKYDEEEPEEEAPSQTVDVADFDNSWASNEYEAMLPNPPFDGWEADPLIAADFHGIKTHDEALDYSIGSHDRMAMANYLAHLEALGFTVFETGYSSATFLGSELPDSWLVVDTEGRTVEICLFCSTVTDDGEYRGYCLLAFDKYTFGDVEFTPVEDEDLPAEQVLSILPPLPFSGWEGGNVGVKVYEYSVTGLNTSGATNPPDSGEPDGKDKDALLAYLSTLPDYGFDVREVGEGYKWTAVDIYGNLITFMIGDGGCFITVEQGNDMPSQQPDTEDEEYDKEDSETLEITLPELPYGEWTREDLADYSYVLTGVNVDHWELEEVFISDLYRDGYNVFEVVPFDGDFYEYQAEKGIGSSLCIIDIQGSVQEGTAIISVTIM